MYICTKFTNKATKQIVYILPKLQIIMKKIFTLALLVLGLSIGSTQAQVKKTWDFSKGWSEETIENLKADTKNWFFEYNDDNSIKAIKENAKLTGDFIANGQYIKELIGLTRGTAGLSKNNNYLLTQKTFRLNRDNQEIIFPRLANGQTITIKGKSANSTAENRGIKASYDYMKLIEGPEDCLIRASLGEVTLKWRVETEGTDSVDIKFSMITGGIDFTLFMIDEGDVTPTAKVAYLYDGTEDELLNMLKTREDTQVTPINVTTETVTAEQLQGFDVTILGNSVPTDNAAVAIVKNALPWTPVLNLNGGTYPVWGYGEAVTGTGTLIVSNLKHELLNGLTIDNGDIIFDDQENVYGLVLSEGEMNFVKPGEYFAGDDTVAVALEDPTAAGIHIHNAKHNGYIYVPYVAGAKPQALKVIDNAITMLSASKSEITQANAPKISRTYKDKLTRVALTAPKQPKARVFYTIDGSDPTEQSTLYTDTIDLTQPCTLKATAIAEGYTMSKVAELEVLIKEQPKTPVIAYEMQGNKTTVKISCESNDADIWYNFTDAGIDTLKSTKYIDSLAVVITMPQNITAFAVAGGEVFSEIATQRVLVQEPRVVVDVAGHFAAQQWTADNNPGGLAVANGKGMFSWGANAATMYTGEGRDSIVVDSETGDETTIKIYSDEDIRPCEVVNEPGENPEWVLTSRGTCLIWQNTTPQKTNFGDDSNYNPMYSTDVDDLFPITRYDIQFYKFQANEPANASISSINKYQAPLDVVVLANMAGGPLLIQVSADSLQWTTIGEIAKSGKSRMWSKYTTSYNGTDAVYVRVTQEVVSAGAKVFDIYVANQGEQSKAILENLKEELTGIQEIVTKSTKMPSGIYSLKGTRLNGMQRGLNIVVNENGQVRKVMMK